MGAFLNHLSLNSLISFSLNKASENMIRTYFRGIWGSLTARLYSSFQIQAIKRILLTHHDCFIKMVKSMLDGGGMVHPHKGPIAAVIKPTSPMNHNLVIPYMPVKAYPLHPPYILR